VRFSLLLSIACAPIIAQAALYEVGPGKPYLTPVDVPWENIGAGDEVRIHWREEPYRNKWVLCAAGTEQSPIVIRGVPGPEGQLPVISGDGATSRSQLNYWGQERSIIKIGGASIPADTTPRHILIENLEVRSGRPPYTFKRTNGTTDTYKNNTAPIWVEKGENITIRNCTLHDSGNGFMVSSSDELASRNILLEGSYIHSNGNHDSLLEHNIYTAAIGMVFQGNRLGPLRPGCRGNNLKDRSAGMVARYNWIEGGNRQFDLVDAEDSELIQEHPDYRKTYVYGNILIEREGDGNSQIVHYGGDSTNVPIYRKGVLHFYHNTIISTRSGNTTLFRLTTNEESCDARNNIFFVTGTGSLLALMESSGHLNLSSNWIKPNWKNSHSGSFGGTITGAASFLTGTDPKFADQTENDLRLRPDSPCVNAAGSLHSDALPMQRQYVPHQTTEWRNLQGVPDIGALEVRRKDAWRWAVFGEDALVNAISSDMADPDQDACINLLEFAGGSDPLDPSSRTGLAPLAPSGAGAVLRFPRLLDAGLSYFVQWSTDLVSWFHGIHIADSAEEMPAQGLSIRASGEDWVEVEASAPIPPAPVFFRLLVRQE
jgi:hypothetical protein